MVAKATTFTQYEGRKEGRKERRKERKKEGRKEGRENLSKTRFIGAAWSIIVDSLGLLDENLII